MNNYFNSKILECNNFSLEEKIKYGIKDNYLKNILLLLINNIVDENNYLIKENRESQSIIDNLNERNESLKEDILYEFNKNKEHKEYKEKETGTLNIDDIVNKLIFDCNNYNMLEKIKYGIKNEELRSLFSEMYIEFKADYEDMEEIKFRLKEFEELNKKIENLKLENKNLKEKLSIKKE